MPSLTPLSLAPADVVLLGLLCVAAVTDAARHRIYNWTTYPGILAGLGLNYAFGGTPALWEASKGFLFCGGLMLLCFVLFPDIGGGDVKLMAMVGACLGTERGIESLLWTMIIGGVAGVSFLIWKHGFLRLVSKALTHLTLIVRTGRLVPLTPEERKPLQRWLFLAPAALAAVCVVLADHRWGLFSRS